SLFDMEPSTNGNGRADGGNGGKAAEKQRLRDIARIKGYEGDACPECGQFTMVRNGACLKCETCGATSGWS
ncbi:MAG: hypothetical protein QM328_14595, partial [Acidobacteriota bacterium]|nr:hypothetical protein [Acidobacteriota bacterium]